MNPYSAHIHAGNHTMDLFVRAYPWDGVASYLESMAVGGLAHVPEIRAWDWSRESRRVGMVCFGVGITECVQCAESLLRAGAEVRIIYANRDLAHAILLDRLRALLVDFPEHFRLRHCLSQPATGSALSTPDASSPMGREGTTRGRVDAAVLAEEFGGAWADGQPVEHFLMVGTGAMERAVLGMLGRAELVDLSQIRGHPEFLLMKGPAGDNTDWQPLSPPASTATARAPLAPGPGSGPVTRRDEL